jgi:trehalose-6-phosphate synthase
MFHYCEDVEGRYSTTSWEAYQKVNQLFAAATISCYQPGDIILVQGYHLLLLPSFLRKQLPEVKIGFFLHIPWPSSEIYRALPVWNELLMGIIEANLIGFQTYAYSRHFFSAVTRLLGYTCDEKVHSGYRVLRFEGCTNSIWSFCSCGSSSHWN